MLMVACREMTSGERGVRVETSSFARSCGRREEGGRAAGAGGEAIDRRRAGGEAHLLHQPLARLGRHIAGLPGPPIGASKAGRVAGGDVRGSARLSAALAARVLAGGAQL